MDHPIPANAQALYEDKIAPLVRELVEQCRKAGLPMFAMFQDGPESFRTTAINGDLAMGEKFRLLRMVHGAWNTDDLIRQLVQEGHEKGHQSLFLKALGVPPEGPEDA